MAMNWALHPDFDLGETAGAICDATREDAAATKCAAC